MDIYLDADFCDVGDEFACHDVMDADGCAFVFSQKNGQMLRFILVGVDAASQCLSIVICQGIAYCVAAGNDSSTIALLYGEHDILITNVCLRAKPNGKCTVEVFCLLRYIETNSVTPLPPLCRQGLVMV